MKSEKELLLDKMRVLNNQMAEIEKEYNELREEYHPLYTRYCEIITGFAIGDIVKNSLSPKNEYAIVSYCDGLNYPYDLLCRKRFKNGSLSSQVYGFEPDQIEKV